MANTNPKRDTRYEKFKDLRRIGELFAFAVSILVLVAGIYVAYLMIVNYSTYQERMRIALITLFHEHPSLFHLNSEQVAEVINAVSLVVTSSYVGLLATWLALIVFAKSILKWLIAQLRTASKHGKQRKSPNYVPE